MIALSAHKYCPRCAAGVPGAQPSGKSTATRALGNEERTKATAEPPRKMRKTPRMQFKNAFSRRLSRRSHLLGGCISLVCLNMKDEVLGGPVHPWLRHDPGAPPQWPQVEAGDEFALVSEATAKTLSVLAVRVDPQSGQGIFSESVVALIERISFSNFDLQRSQMYS